MKGNNHRPMATLSRTRTLIEQDEDYGKLFKTLNDEDQAEITHAVQRLVGLCNNMGVKGALELLIRLGEYFVKEPGMTKN